MKTKHLLFTMALPLAFVACTNDEFESNSMSQAQNGELVTLPDNYLLAGVMGSDAATRSMYDGTAFAWLPFDNFAASPAADAIGLCWRGGEYTSNGAVVYTNYKFTHYGWLGKDEEKPDLNCDGDLLNGQLLTDLSGNQAALLAGTWPVADAAKYPDLKVDAKNGLFNTDNSTIFKGDYIVYYPYNDQFNEVGNIPATAPANIKRDIKDLDETNYTKELAKEVFVAGTMNGVDGGQQNGVFSTNFVSGSIVVKIKNTDASNDLNIHKVVLVADNGFATEVKLDASKIAAGEKGAALYAEEPSEFANTLVAEFYNSGSTNAQADLVINPTETQRVAFAVLPTTASTALKNAKVILVDNDGNSYLVESDLQKLVSLAEGWNVIEVSAKPSDFTAVAYAYDTESLIKVLMKSQTATGEGQINVLNKITLDPDYSFNLGYGGDSDGALKDKFKRTDKSIYIQKSVTLTGKGAIVVPAGLQLVFKSVGTEDEPATVTFEVPLITENKGCCGEYNGTVVLRTAKDSYGKYVFSQIKNEGTIYLGSDLTGVVDITVDELINNGGLINAYGIGYWNNTYDKASHVTIGKLTNTYVARDYEEDDVKVNNGRMNIVAKFWDPKTEQKQAAPVNSSRRVNMTIGDLNNGEGAYILVGKRTFLNIEGTATNTGRIKVETAALTTNNKEDGQMYITTSGSVSNEGLIENYGVINNEGSLKNTDAEADIVDYVGCQFGGNKVVALPGEYICEVEDTNVKDGGDRVGYAMGENMPTTTIRFVGNSETYNETGKYVYNLAGYKTNNELPYNFIIAAESLVELRGLTDKGEATSVKINGKLTVNKDSKLTVSQIKLNVADAVIVDGTMNANPIKGSSATTTDTDNVFAAEKDVTVNGTFEVVKFAKTDLNGNMFINKGATATFNYATYTDVANVLNIDGTFNRVVSSGTSTANPAQVYCGSYVKGSNAVIANGLPQTR